MATIELNDISIRYGKKTFIDQLNLQIKPGMISTIIGPNGSGKSTLLKTMARILQPETGSVLLSGKDIHQLASKQVAQQLAILPQHIQTPEQMTVSELVWLGRHPHQRFLKGRSERDEQAVYEALEQTDMLAFATRDVKSLSGGQQQRAWIAMALAQDTPCLLLDEPTTFLDMAHQLDVLELLKKLNRTQQKTIVMVLHDINLAARYSDELILLSNGMLMAQGTPQDILTETLLYQIFNINVRVLADPQTNTPYFIPYTRMMDEEY